MTDTSIGDEDQRRRRDAEWRLELERNRLTLERERLELERDRLRLERERMELGSRRLEMRGRDTITGKGVTGGSVTCPDDTVEDVDKYVYYEKDRPHIIAANEEFGKRCAEKTFGNKNS